MVQLNPVPVFGAKKIPVPFEGNPPKFPCKWSALPKIAVLLIKFLIFFHHSVVSGAHPGSVHLMCSLVPIDAFKRYNSWTDTFRKSTKFDLS